MNQSQLIQNSYANFLNWDNMKITQFLFAVKTPSGIHLGDIMWDGEYYQVCFKSAIDIYLKYDGQQVMDNNTYDFVFPTGYVNPQQPTVDYRGYVLYADQIA